MSNMSPHQLIEHLTADLQPKPVFVAWRRVLPALIITAAVAMLIIVTGMGLREVWPITAYAKAGLFISLSVLLWSQIVKNTTPVETNTGAAWALFGVTLSALLILATHAQPMTTYDVFQFAGYPQCFIFITIMGAVMWSALRYVMRDARPALNARMFGAALGTAAGTLVAGLYAMHCPMDSSQYLALAYWPPILLLALIGGVFPHRAWRW